jgi:nucleoid DNA-binding protein
VNESNQSIWDHVKSLLHQHDCVIVPGFGGFVCNREPAKIDQVSHVITPPSRKVVFNQNLKTNDGLLAGYLAQKEQLNYSQAIQLVEQTVASTLAILHEKKTYAVDLFGNFRLNADANYVFLPDKRNNYLVSSYGLGLIQALPVASRTIKTPKARVFKEKTNSPRTPKKAIGNAWPKVLSLVLIALLSVNGYIFLKDHSLTDLQLGNNSTMSITSWFDSILTKPTEQIDTAIEPAKVTITPTPVAKVNIAIVDTNVSLLDSATVLKNQRIDTYAALYAFAAHYQSARSSIYFPQQQPEIDSVTFPETTPELTTNTTTSAELSTVGIAKGFYVIGGVFCKTRNLKRFIQQLTSEGYTETEILINTDINCKRVSYKKFTSHQEAEQFSKAINAKSNTQTWVLSAN